jgi:aminodeoxyfutalosine deaminase
MSALDPKMLHRIDAKGCRISLAAHASYSTSAKVIQQAREWCRIRKAPFSIHVAEHPDEIEFLQYGTGYCRDLLKRLGKWVESWRPPRMTPVEYLDSLGILDSGTLLVHAVHMENSDWEIALKRNCSVCFCPRSNLNINVGQPAIAESLQLGVKVCLGTDSLASNQDLSLFAEAAHVLKHHPDVPPDSLLVMMTKGGAQALGQSDRFGSLIPGGSSSFLSVQLDRSTPLTHLSEEIIRQGNRGEWKWVNQLRNS